MKQPPKTPIEFDYDLWTTEDGKCMVRVKITGEITEVDREVMKVLRNEEKKLRRSMIGAPVEGCEDTGETLSVLSLSYVSVQESEDMSPAWLADTYDMEQEVVWSMLEQDFKRSLTLRQQEVFDCCLIRGMSLSSYAREKGLDVSTVHKTKLAIRKKAKIILKGIPKNE